ncbi:MAG TPA: SIS domain-containing protein, partial [Anaerolineales bacterium]|nr:SIS domain-containing protein [Anaerolineales bacterium]
MNLIHPMLTNILSLADIATWQKSIQLAEEALTDWKKPQNLQRVYFVGHGSSLFNGLVGETILEHICGIPAKAVPAFAFSQYAEPSLLGPEALVVGISTTGETESVGRALERARLAGSSTLAITAHKDASITQHADTIILTGGEDDQI